MMEKKDYQLVAWTENVADLENARLFMDPALERDVQDSLIEDVARIHRHEYRNHGLLSLDLAVEAVRACENMSRFKLLTGHYGDGIRYLFFAARYCLRDELRHELARLCEEALRLAKKYGREDVLQEQTPRRVLDHCRN